MTYLVLFQVLSSAGTSERLARLAERVRASRGKRIPVGSYRFDGEIGIGFGHEDTTLILRLPVPDAIGQRPTTYTGVTDASTRFSVGHKDASPDELLEAYDDSVGALEVVVYEPGRIAEIGIAADAARR